MMTIEIAGHTLVYRNAPDLNEKVRAELQELREKAQSIEKHSAALRKQERIFMRFLGEGKKFAPVTPKVTLTVNQHYQEEARHA